MFSIIAPSENDSFPLIQPNAAPILDAIISGLKNVHGIKNGVLTLEEHSAPNTAFSLKLYFPNMKERTVVLQLAECGRLIEIYLESDLPCLISIVGHKFQIYPTTLLSNTPRKKIEEFAEIKLFALMYGLIRLSVDYNFRIIQNKKELDTDSPIIAIHKACIELDAQPIALEYSEPDIYEDTEVRIYINKDTKIAQISGGGVSSMDILILAFFAEMMTPPLCVEYM